MLIGEFKFATREEMEKLYPYCPYEGMEIVSDEYFQDPANQERIIRKTVYREVNNEN